MSTETSPIVNSGAHTCVTCHKQLPKEQFSKRQWKQKGKPWGARCKGCVEIMIANQRITEQDDELEDYEAAHVGKFMDSDEYLGHGEFNDY